MKLHRVSRFRSIVTVAAGRWGLGSAFLVGSPVLLVDCCTDSTLRIKTVVCFSNFAASWNDMEEF
jgi:hypothetical protein